MPTDSSKNLHLGAVGSAGPDEHGEDSRKGSATPAPSPAHSLKFRGTLFGSTLARVFSAVDQVKTGEVVSITTNDP